MLSPNPRYDPEFVKVGGGSHLYGLRECIKHPKKKGSCRSPALQSSVRLYENGAAKNLGSFGKRYFDLAEWRWRNRFLYKPENRHNVI